MAVQLLQVAGVDARDSNNAIVTLLVKANDKWLELAVPVYTKDGAMVISGRPRCCPRRAARPYPAAAKDRDSDLEAQLKPTLESFFKAYAISDQSILGRCSPVARSTDWAARSPLPSSETLSRHVAMPGSARSPRRSAGRSLRAEQGDGRQTRADLPAHRGEEG